jgi:hypothetical protein
VVTGTRLERLAKMSILLSRVGRVPAFTSSKMERSRGSRCVFLLFIVAVYFNNLRKASVL